jgi:hypothetical protein
MTRRWVGVAGGIAILLLALAAVVATQGGHRPPGRGTVDVPAARGPIVAHPPRVIRIAPAQLARARVAGRRFLAGYLPYLYGRGSARSVVGVLPTVATALRKNHPRVTPAQRRRHPQVRFLTLRPQTRTSILATARIIDGGIAAYGLTFTLERRGRRWLVSDLASD